MTGPYANAAPAYWQAGWRGILPLPARRKKYPPKGYTGGDGVDPSYPDLQSWVDGDEGNGNICLRMPPTVIGIDVDDYDDKTGGATIAAAATRWGALPATWRSTSRDDGISGIRLYRVPEGLAWPHVVGDSVEVIRASHRYSVVWPSMHPEGRTYRWINPDGVVTTVIPDIDTLPTLPEQWVMGLTGGELAADVVRNTLDDINAGIWLATRDGATDGACARMTKAVTGANEELSRSGTSAHDTACAATSRIIRLAADGHRGLAGGLADVRAVFFRNITAPTRIGHRRRSQAEAEAEWHSLVTTGVNLVTASPSSSPSCDCDAQLTGLIIGDPYPTSGSAALAPHIDTDPTDPPDPAQTDLRDHTSWWPRSLDGIIDGHDEEPNPTILTRDDGIALFYRGKINGLLGESESGKTWVALHAVEQTLDAGAHVIYLDLEDTPTGIVGRLRSLGVPDDHLTRLHYIGPEETLNDASSQDLRETIETTRPDLIVLDGFNAAMTLLGFDINDNGDATKFAQILLRPLSMAGGGAAVVYVDHLPKNKDNRGKGGIGAQAKRAMTTGSALTVDVLAPFGRGMTGRLKLTVDKDRPGHVRAESAEAKRAGVAVLTSDRDTGGIQVVIEAPNKATPKQRDDGRRLLLMERISEYLETKPERASQRAVEETIGGNAGVVRAALTALVNAGNVVREKDGASYRHVVMTPFTVAEALSTDPVRPCVQSASRVRPDAPAESGKGSASGASSPVGDATQTHTPDDTPDSRSWYEKPGRTLDGHLVDETTGEILP